MKGLFTKQVFLLAALLAGITFGSSSCTKKENYTTGSGTNPNPTQNNTATVNVRFDYVFGSNQLPFELNKLYVHPKTNDSITFTNIKYYVSNLKLKNANGSWWVQPDSYFLLDAKSAQESTIALTGVPHGTYTEMQYTMGVDSAKNVSGAHDGDLSFTYGMFWDWNSGYIMVKLEGNSPSAPTAANTFALHLGGFAGADNIVTTNTADLSASPLVVNSSKTHTVALAMNPAKVWHSSPGLDSIYIIHSPGGEAVTMGKNLFSGVIFKGIE